MRLMTAVIGIMSFEMAVSVSAAANVRLCCDCIVVKDFAKIRQICNFVRTAKTLRHTHTNARAHIALKSFRSLTVGRFVCKAYNSGFAYNEHFLWILSILYIQSAV